MSSTITPIDSGGIMLSYKCNCTCKHCLYAGSPAWKEWIGVQDVSRIFEGLNETSSRLQGFHIAGGEPFLDFDRLLRVQRLATEFGIPIEYVETNAGWCSSEEITAKRFDLLRNAGLKCILISCSPFHAERITLSHVIRAVKVGADIFGPSGVILWVPEFYQQIANIATNRSISLNEYIDSVGESIARYTIRSKYSLITGGRMGYQIADMYERRPPECCKDNFCRPELLESGHAHFDPYGNLIPCFCSGISLGDARDLQSLMYYLDLSALPIVSMLVESGPYGLYKFAVKEYGYVPIKAGYIGKCHLCVDVRRWIQSRTGKYKELAPAQFYKELVGNGL